MRELGRSATTPLILAFSRPLDLKIHLATTAYGNFLQNEASPLAVSTIDDKLKERLVHEFNHIRSQCVEPLATFLDFITFGASIWYRPCHLRAGTRT